MTTPSESTFSYQTSFVLNKDYFNECYEQSTTENNTKKNNNKAIILTLAGLTLLLLSANAYIGWFLIALGILEIFSNRYHQAWWVTRQMLSRASRSTVTITLNEHKIATQSPYLESHIPWAEISKITITDKGYLFHSAKGRSYLSKKYLSTSAQQFIAQKAQTITARTSK